MVTYSPRSKLGTLLPEFPNIKEFKWPPDVAMDKVCVDSSYERARACVRVNV